MYIDNGRFRGDSYGGYPYSSSLGISTVDYIITDLNPESLKAFTVSPLTLLSDHSKITVYLNRAMLNHEASKPKELSKIKKCYRWKECSVEIYQKTIRQQQIQFKFNFLDKTFHCNSEGVHLAVENVFPIKSKNSNRKPKKMNNNHKWFDEECKNIRKKLRNLSNQKHRNPEYRSLLLHYGESLKQYRNTLQQKKEQHIRNQLNVLNNP